MDLSFVNFVMFLYYLGLWWRNDFLYGKIFLKKICIRQISPEVRNRKKIWIEKARVLVNIKSNKSQTYKCQVIRNMKLIYQQTPIPDNTGPCTKPNFYVQLIQLQSRNRNMVSHEMSEIIFFFYLLLEMVVKHAEFF